MHVRCSNVFTSLPCSEKLWQHGMWENLYAVSRKWVLTVPWNNTTADTVGRWTLNPRPLPDDYGTSVDCSGIISINLGLTVAMAKLVRLAGVGTGDRINKDKPSAHIRVLVCAGLPWSELFVESATVEWESAGSARCRDDTCSAIATSMGSAVSATWCVRALRCARIAADCCVVACVHDCLPVAIALIHVSFHGRAVW